MKPGTIYETAAQTAKRVRKILKQKFPGVKFSVRSKTYSGGSSVRVSWTDGPLGSHVEKAIQFLESATFDAMQDLKGSAPPMMTDDDGMPVYVHGADWIHCDRSLSPQKEAEREQRVRDHFDEESAEKILSGPEAWYWKNKLEEESQNSQPSSQ